jgi:hypothetical protein
MKCGLLGRVDSEDYMNKDSEELSLKLAQRAIAVARRISIRGFWITVAGDRGDLRGAR